VTEIRYVRQPIEFPARYAHGPDSLVQPGVPRGALHEYASDKSRVFLDTHRRYWAYVPVQYTPSEPVGFRYSPSRACALEVNKPGRRPRHVARSEGVSRERRGVG
jgi:hypothetical protein